MKKFSFRSFAVNLVLIYIGVLALAASITAVKADTLNKAEDLPSESKDVSDLTFSFPWPKSATWQVTQGFYGPYSHTGNRAIDFVPKTSDYTIIAPETGVLSLDCEDEAQVILRISHENGFFTRYIHLDRHDFDARSRIFLGRTIAKGQVLGIIYSGTQKNMPKSPPICQNLGAQQLRFSTKCGCGQAAHLHMEFSKDVLINGYSASQLHSGQFTSDNERDDYNGCPRRNDGQEIIFYLGADQNCSADGAGYNAGTGGVSRTLCKWELNGQSLLKADDELVEDQRPTKDGRCPFLGDIAVDQKEQFSSSIAGRERSL